MLCIIYAGLNKEHMRNDAAETQRHGEADGPSRDHFGSALHAALCTARHGVASAPNTSAKITASRENVARVARTSRSRRC
jgi:hypothetical protein